MPIFLVKYWRQAAIIGCALLLAYAIKRYGTIEYESGATDEKVQVTKDLEKNVQMRYAAAVKQLETDKAQVAQAQAALAGQSSAIQSDRANFNNNIASKLSAIDNASKGNITDANKTPDDQLNALARQWIAHLSARK